MLEIFSKMGIFVLKIGIFWPRVLQVIWGHYMVVLEGVRVMCAIPLATRHWMRLEVPTWVKKNCLSKKNLILPLFRVRVGRF